MRPGFAIRPADVSEGPAIVEVVRAAIRVSAVGLYDAVQLDAWASGWGRDGLTELLSNTMALVAVDEHELIGCANFEGAEIGQLFVRPDYGGRGVARRLYRAVEDVARVRSLDGLRAVASLATVPAFVRFGFVDDLRTTRAFNGSRFEVVLVSKHFGEPPGA